jgi:hypothetical protein
VIGSGMRSFAIAVASLVLASPALALDVTSCGVVVPAREIAEVRNDLVCASGTGVTLQSRATLRLNGFRFSGAALGISCAGPCTIEGGGGSISDMGIAVQHAKGRLVVSELEIFDVELGVQSLHRSSVVVATDVVAHDTEYPFVVAGKLVATNVTTNDSYYGIAAIRGIVAVNVTAANNQFTGMYSRRKIEGSGIAVTGNGGYGIQARRVDASDVTASGNQSGVVALNTLLTDSTLTGNQTDLASFQRPRLVNTACDTSLRLDSMPPASWNVCAND